MAFLAAVRSALDGEAQVVRVVRGEAMVSDAAKATVSSKRCIIRNTLELYDPGSG